MVKQFGTPVKVRVYFNGYSGPMDCDHYRYITCIRESGAYTLLTHEDEGEDVYLRTESINKIYIDGER